MQKKQISALVEGHDKKRFLTEDFKTLSDITASEAWVAIQSMFSREGVTKKTIRRRKRAQARSHSMGEGCSSRSIGAIKLFTQKYLRLERKVGKRERLFAPKKSNRKSFSVPATKPCFKIRTNNDDRYSDSIKASTCPVKS